MVTIYLVNLLLPLNKKILIIEKGTSRQSSNNKNRNINSGIFHKASTNYSGIKMGGNSSRWGGQLAEMTKEDFNKCFCVGFNKTWTTTLERVLRTYGYRMPSIEEQELRFTKNFN